MKKLVFYILGTCLLSMFIPFQLKAATTVISDSLVIPIIVEHPERRSLRIFKSKNSMIDRSKSVLSQKDTLKLVERDGRHYGSEMKGSIYVSYGIGFLITILVIILL